MNVGWRAIRAPTDTNLVFSFVLTNLGNTLGDSLKEMTFTDKIAHWFADAQRRRLWRGEPWRWPASAVTTPTTTTATAARTRAWRPVAAAARRASACRSPRAATRRSTVSHYNGMIYQSQLRSERMDRLGSRYGWGSQTRFNTHRLSTQHSAWHVMEYLSMVTCKGLRLQAMYTDPQIH